MATHPSPTLFIPLLHRPIFDDADQLVTPAVIRSLSGLRDSSSMRRSTFLGFLNCTAEIRCLKMTPTRSPCLAEYERQSLARLDRFGLQWLYSDQVHIRIQRIH